ncbi:CGNR zinc finger domain-containing protein [Mesorhizobium sp. L-8-3]|uniref:CGNR zinc finger domain-containing protein n=1 Tax=Mesorhizobium sp. L-8-3 TaxID=2744522 RepID=UPI0019295CA1|nr:CGNR zinc finger domain-containing protein [Mesorhizobium sp. L-8-3]
MAVSWTAHRFAGGVLALDAANTVVLRGDPRGFDRFAEPIEIARFAEAAGRFRREELGNRRLSVADPEAVRPLVLEIREATDSLFRGAVQKGRYGGGALPRLLRACAAGLEGHDDLGLGERPFGDPATPLAFEAALAVSALSLLSTGTTARLRICPNCNWLFLDRSRNSSRLWCDMAVCGNRQKARRHYRRRLAAQEGLADA